MVADQCSVGVVCPLRSATIIQSRLDITCSYFRLIAAYLNQISPVECLQYIQHSTPLTARILSNICLCERCCSQPRYIFHIKKSV